MNLVISTIGKQNITNLWVNDKRDFDVLLIDYSNNPTKSFNKKGLKKVNKKGFKYPLIKWAIKTYKLDYDNYIFIDDDIAISANEIQTIFDISKQHNLQVAHPAMLDKNMSHITHLHKDPFCKFRITNWIELQCVFMTKKALNKLLWTFDINESGYGYPDLWNKELCEKNGIGALAIIDEVEALHSLPMFRYGTSNIKIEKAFNEFETLLKNYKIEKKPAQTVGHYTRNIVSIVVIYNQDKAHYIPEMLTTLPKDSEIILVETIQDLELEKEKLTDIDRQNNYVHAKYYYKDWNYAYARNAAKSLATRPIIFSLDSDERLLTHQHDMILKECIKLHLSDYLGMTTVTLSVNENVKNPDGRLQSSHNTRVNIFKNIPELYWTGSVHETIDYRILQLGKKYRDSAIKIDHVGYNVKPIEMLEKARFRVETYLKFPNDLENEFYFDKLVQECYNYKIFKEGINASGNT